MLPAAVELLTQWASEKDRNRLLEQSKIKNYKLASDRRQSGGRALASLNSEVLDDPESVTRCHSG